jgi:glycosyltransferase involved in cell wall biosynthesis
VRFVGGGHEVKDLISALDVAVQLPELPESFGLAVVEGMANGTAVVAADSGAVREIVEPGVTALLVPPGDDETLATALLALHDDPERRRSLAAAGAEAARARFDMLKTTRRLEQIYRDVLAR